MSDFLLVIPAGWTEIPEVAGLIAFGSFSADEFFSAISTESWGDIDNMLSSAVLLPEGKVTTAARLINTDAGYRFWVKFSV